MLQALRAEAGPLDFFVFICWRAALLEARPLKRGIHAQHDAKSLSLHTQRDFELYFLMFVLRARPLESGCHQVAGTGCGKIQL